MNKRTFITALFFLSLIMQIDDSNSDSECNECVISYTSTKTCSQWIDCNDPEGYWWQFTGGCCHIYRNIFSTDHYDCPLITTPKKFYIYGDCWANPCTGLNCLSFESALQTRDGLGYMCLIITPTSGCDR